MADTSTHPKPDKKRKRKAASALLLLLKRTRKVCGSFGKAEEWYGYVKKYVEPVLKEYGDVIPQEVKDTLHEAENVSGTGREAINRTCKHLKKNLELGAKVLGGGSGATGALATLIVAGVLVAAGTMYLNKNAVTISIRNTGCAPIRPVAYLPFEIPGLSLPKDTIADGQSATAKVPPVTFSLNVSAGTIQLAAYGLRLSFGLTSGGIDVLFDGQSLLSGQKTISLSPRSTHTVEARCR